MISTFVVTPPTHSKMWSFEIDYIFDLVISLPPQYIVLLWDGGSPNQAARDYSSCCKGYSWILEKMYQWNLYHSKG